MKLWYNGEMKTQAHCDATAAGLLLGQGVFTTIGIWSGRPFLLEHHLARLRENATALDIPLAWGDEEITDALKELLLANQIENGIARLTATARGDGRWNEQTSGDLLIIARPRATENIVAPLRLTLSPFRLDARRPLAGIKSTSYAEYSRIACEAQKRGFDEAIICNGAGILSECARANLFWARGETLFTPSLQTGALPGVARRFVLECCALANIEVREGAFSLFDLTDADEVFLTAATTGPRAVASLSWMEEECRYIAPGVMTRQLEAIWKEAIG